MRKLCDIFFFLSYLMIGINGENVIVEIPDGKLNGTVLKSRNNNDFYAFYKIPYAAAPVGSLRFMPPQSPEPWNDTRDATENNVMCYQSSEGIHTASEDCLFLNVFTPIKPGESNDTLPVFFWIHGGAFRAGSGNDMVPNYWMDYEIVVVAINYRLGPFGFLSTEDDIIPGNYGLKDQRYAMEWVNQNIKYFNGDPNKVTIGGQSAGSTCVGIQLLGSWSANNSTELFHGAVQESGSPIWNFYNDNATMHAFEVGRGVDSNFTSNSSSDLLTLLQSASAADIMNVTISGHWAPIIEAEGNFSYPPLESFMSGNVKKIPLLIGSTTEEQLNAASEAKTDGRLAAYDKNPAMLLSSPLLNVTDKNYTGTLIKNVYTDSFEENYGAYVRYFSDDTFRTPSVKEATLMSTYTDVYLYQFAYKGEMGGMQVTPVEGCDTVIHAEELNYMWGSDDNSSYPEEDIITSERLLLMWSNFIKYQNPTPEQVSLLQYLTWPTVDFSDLDNIKYVNINVTLDVLINPRNFQNVRKIYDEYLEEPFIIYTNNDGPFN